MVGAVGPVDCALHAGEVVGLVGLRGAGQELVGRASSGWRPVTGGRVLLDGAPLAADLGRRGDGRRRQPRLRRPRAAKSVLPEPERSGEHVPQPAGRRAGPVLLPRAAPRSAEASRDLGARIGLRPNDPALAIELLSGGNQQKVVVGRWLHLGSKVYIFEDPTAGVDVGAKAEIYRLFDVALAAGAAILIVSTDFEEVAKVCHRALVFDRGRVVAELGAADLSVENLLAAASARMAIAATGPPVSAHAVH